MYQAVKIVVNGVVVFLIGMLLWYTNQWEHTHGTFEFEKVIVMLLLLIWIRVGNEKEKM